MAIDIRRNYTANNEYEDKEAQQAELDKKMKEFLKKGGKIEIVPPGAAQGAGGLDMRPHWTDAELKEKWRQENGIKEEPKKKKGRRKRKK
tara:strand:- start:395 stop:664 length:270 start_codon:yes stop_codon:yes gene_type:complete